MRPRSFWPALTVGVVSAVAAAVCLTAGYYESRVIPAAEAEAAQEVVDEPFAAPGGLEDPGLDQVDPDIMVLADPQAGNARPWWIAGAVFSALAVASFALALARRPRSP